jgi:hypothetical protein
MSEINSEITAEICTKGRYYTTLPSAMLSLCTQEILPCAIILYDDNPPAERKDLREVTIYNYIFKLMDEKGIKWSVMFGEGRGQVLGHQRCQEAATTSLVFRMDDDNILEPNVLKVLYSKIK